MKRIPLFFIFVAISLITSTTAHAQKDKFVGTFISTDAPAHSITRLTVSADYHLHIWAKCSSGNCDWGSVRAVSYGPNSSSDLRASADAVSGFYDQNFATRIVILKLVDKNRLQIEVFTKFNDKDRRSAYVTRQILERQQIALK